MQSHVNLSDPLSSRTLRTSQSAPTRPAMSVQQAETSNPVQRKSQSIEVGQLPMVRKGGGTAIMFDRMDQNGNGVLTRAELISYRLAPMVTHTPAEISPMPTEAMAQIGQAAKAKIAETADDTGTPPETGISPKNGYGSTDSSLEAVFGISEPSMPEFAATPAPADTSPAPSSLPESVVMAQAASVAAPEFAFA